MKKNILLLTILILLFNSSFAQNKYVGNWLGSLKVQAISLRIVFKITENPDRTLHAVLNSPDQTDKDIPVEEVVLKNDSIRLNVTSIKGYYEGILTNDTTLSGTWHQGPMSLSLDMYRKDVIAVTQRSQTPKKPYPYKEEEVTFVNKTAGDTLAGTFTYPDNKDNYPAVILITGSGPQDRDESLLGHKPFLVLADYLTRHGIAVLRYDDRGFGKSTGKFKAATTLDFATDAEAAINYLKTRKGVDIKNIGLLGHSEGGIIAPIIASRRNDVGFIVLMAGPGVSGAKILPVQIEKISLAEGMNQKDINKITAMNAKIFNLVTSERDSSKATQKIEKIFDEYYAALPDSEKSLPQNHKETFMRQMSGLFDPWFKTFLTLDPSIYLSKTKVPVLAINGDKDLQVDSKQNLPAIEKALKKAGNKNYKVIELKNMNHLFQTTQTGSPSEYSQIDETISPIALQTISDWILTQTKGK